MEKLVKEIKHHLNIGWFSYKYNGYHIIQEMDFGYVMKYRVNNLRFNSVEDCINYINKKTA